VSARSYLTQPTHSERRGVKVFNLCKSYRYQSLGYYVSLLATARGHKPAPSVATMQDMKAHEIVRIRSEDLDELIQHSLAPIVSSHFELSIYFGRNLARRYDRLSAKLFQLFYAPLLRANFVRARDGRWTLQGVSTISADDIPDSHTQFVLEVATEYFKAKRWSAPRQRLSRYDLAILFDPLEREPPSDERAIAKFVKAAQALGMTASLIQKDDYARLAEFDALFIRETTSVHHHTYRFARRALAEGMVVIDDPDSILRCTNKVYLKELMDRHHVPAPHTMIVHRDNVQQVSSNLGLPCILKKPDSAFSQGVLKVDSIEDLRNRCEELLAKSELVIAQQFMPTEFDWRVGVLDGKALWCAKYHMASRHWQIMKHEGNGRTRYGKVEAVDVAQAPTRVVRTALRAAALIGEGLYGVDLKTVGGKTYVVEVNDNPSIEAGEEDAILKEALYENIMRVFLKRLEAGQEHRAIQ
jgi:glutathione synthase/RimK-type ligase-like ATP-grasp enzyme